MKNPLGIHALVWAGSWNSEHREKAIALSAKYGYDLIEIPLLEPREIDVSGTVKLLEQYNLKAATSLALSPQTDISSPEPDIVAKGETLLNEALLVARDLGANYLGGVLYSALQKYNSPPVEVGRHHCIEVLSRLADKAKQMGMTIGLEAVNRYESNLINTAAQALEIIAETGSDNIVVHLDSFHMNIEEESFSEAITLCAEKLGYFHLGESNRGYLGSGTIDFASIFKSLRDNHYTGVITFESFSSTVVTPHLSNALALWRNLWDDSEKLAHHAKYFMEKHLHSAESPSS